MDLNCGFFSIDSLTQDQDLSFHAANFARNYEGSSSFAKKLSNFGLYTLESYFLIEYSWSSLYFHESLFIRHRAGFTQAFIGNQIFGTAFTKSSIFIRNETLRTALTWTIKMYYFLWFAFWAWVSVTIGECTIRTWFTFPIDIYNIPFIRTWYTFPPIRA